MRALGGRQAHIDLLALSTNSLIELPRTRTKPPSERTQRRSSWRERVRGTLVRITTQSGRTERFRATTRSARAINQQSDCFGKKFGFCSGHTAKKALRIFLLILIIIGIILLFTQKIWVPKLVNRILLSENIQQQISKNTTTIPNESTKTDLIHLDTPLRNQVIKSPLIIKGVARGSWFFEASFPVILTNWDGLIIAQGIAKTKSNRILSHTSSK